MYMYVCFQKKFLMFLWWICSFRPKIKKKNSLHNSCANRIFLYPNNNTCFYIWNRFTIIIHTHHKISSIVKGIYKVNMLLWRITYFFTCPYYHVHLDYACTADSIFTQNIARLLSISHWLDYISYFFRWYICWRCWRMESFGHLV